MGSSNWIWHAAIILYLIGYEASQSIGFRTDGLSAKHIGFSADGVEYVGTLAGRIKYNVGFAADTSAAKHHVSASYYSNRNLGLKIASSRWSELGVSRSYDWRSMTCQCTIHSSCGSVVSQPIGITANCHVWGGALPTTV